MLPKTGKIERGRHGAQTIYPVRDQAIESNRHSIVVIATVACLDSNTPGWLPQCFQPGSILWTGTAIYSVLFRIAIAADLHDSILTVIADYPRRELAAFDASRV